MTKNDAIRINGFAMYFRCENTQNCFSVSKNGTDLAEWIDDGRHFSANEVGGKRVEITAAGRKWILENRLMTPADASGKKHWMSPPDLVPQLVNLLPRA